jgi:hypothetical protein
MIHLWITSISGITLGSVRRRPTVRLTPENHLVLPGYQSSTVAGVAPSVALRMAVDPLLGRPPSGLRGGVRKHGPQELLYLSEAQLHLMAPLAAQESLQGIVFDHWSIFT